MSKHFDPERPEGQELPPTLASGADPDPTASGDLVGRVLAGRYRILRKLGEGAMGAVYLGEHLKIGRQDAIKVLRDQLATDPDTIARFVRGTRNVSMIRHPNICTIYDYSDTADGIQFVAMEFVPGETLRDLLQREGRLPMDAAVHIAEQAAEALEAAHEVGIVHRDLKPANIMVVRGRGGATEVKVVDFDIAKGSRDGEGEEVTRMGFVVGTPEYMSPEQLIGDRLDGRSDVYSLALVLYRMLTGVLPFTAQDTQDLMVKRLTEPPMALAQGLPGSSFPAALEASIRRALQRKPAERQATAAEFGREIVTAIASTAVETQGRPGGTVTPRAAAGMAAAGGAAERSRGRKEPVRSRMILGGAAAATAIALAAIAVVAYGGEDGESIPPLASTAPTAEIVEYSDPLLGRETDRLQDAGVEADPIPTPPAAQPAAGIESSSSPVAQTESADEASTGLESTVAAGRPEPSSSAPPGQAALMSMLERVTQPYPSRTHLLAIRDTAASAWEDQSTTTRNRALAAYVAGSSLVALGDTAQAVSWLQRAVQLRPDYDPYRTELNLYRRLTGGY